MSADLQLVRGDVEGYNLAIGEPVVLQAHVMKAFGIPVVTGPLNYPCLGGEKELLSVLQRMYPNSKVVVTNGAKQAIEAAFFAFKSVHGKTGVFHSPPHWPSYPTLSKNQGLQFSTVETDASYDASYIKVVTSPNNPDGKEQETVADIYDAVYGSEVYGMSKLVQAKVRLYSAAKMFGLSGLRVGWAVTEDAELADKMAYYVEITTSGVAVSSQRILANVMTKIWGSLAFISNDARSDILMNGSMFNRYIADFCEAIDGVPQTGKGMFAWFKVRNLDKFQKALVKSKVFVVTGDACGMPEPGWFRMSMGQDRKITQEALLKLRENLSEE